MTAEKGLVVKKTKLKVNRECRNRKFIKKKNENIITMQRKEVNGHEIDMLVSEMYLQRMWMGFKGNIFI